MRLVVLAAGVLFAGVAQAQWDRLSPGWQPGPVIAVGAPHEIPLGPEWRWLRARSNPDDRREILRRLIAEPSLTLTSETFDIMSMLAATDGFGGVLARGSKFALVGGSAGYTFSRWLGIGDPWTVGTASLAGGFLFGSLSDAAAPDSFTLTCDGCPFSLTLGWQEKPGYLPRANPAFAGWGLLNSATAGASLRLRAAGWPEATLFFDPFADHRATYAGLVFSGSF